VFALSCDHRDPAANRSMVDFGGPLVPILAKANAPPAAASNISIPGPLIIEPRADPRNDPAIAEPNVPAAPGLFALSSFGAGLVDVDDDREKLGEDEEDPPLPPPPPPPLGILISMYPICNCIVSIHYTLNFSDDALIIVI